MDLGARVHDLPIPAGFGSAARSPTAGGCVASSRPLPPRSCEHARVIRLVPARHATTEKGRDNAPWYSHLGAAVQVAQLAALTDGGGREFLRRLAHGEAHARSGPAQLPPPEARSSDDDFWQARPGGLAVAAVPGPEPSRPPWRARGAVVVVQHPSLRPWQFGCRRDLDGEPVVVPRPSTVLRAVIGFRLLLGRACGRRHQGCGLRPVHRLGLAVVQDDGDKLVGGAFTPPTVIRVRSWRCARR